MESELKTTDLLTQAAEWRLISLFFECPRGGWFVNVKELSREIHDRKLKEAARAAMDEADEGLYHSIFGPGGPCPSREVSYRNWVQPGMLLSELSAFYKAFSFTPATEEVPDHISVEAAFVSYLFLKEAFALESELFEQAATTADARDHFIKQHLSKSGEKFAETLKYSEMKYLQLAGEALFERTGKDPDGESTRKLPVFGDVERESMLCADSDTMPDPDVDMLFA